MLLCSRVIYGSSVFNVNPGFISRFFSKKVSDLIGVVSTCRLMILFLQDMFAKMKKVNGEVNVDDGGGGDGGSPPKKPAKQRTKVEEIYQKKSQLEHILLRPDTYIGSVETVKENMWVYDTESEKMVQKEITYVPGLYKIFDEILVNAADNKQRDKKMDCVKIDIDP